MKMHARMLVQTILLVLLLLLNVAAPARGENSTARSGCQVCADTGDCARAFHGGPGQFCGSWLDRTNARQSCCCPTDAVCRVTNYACNCAYANRGGDRYGYGDGYGDSRGYGSALEWLWWLLGSLLVLFCCSGLLFMVCRRRRRQDDAETPMAYATAEPTPPTYGAYGSTPSAPVYAAQPVYGGAVPGSYAGGGVVQQPVYSGVGRSGGGMSAGAGAALGGGAGLLGGLLLGEAIADAGRSGYGGGGFDGGGVAADGFDGGGGGGDFGGDF